MIQGPMIRDNHQYCFFFFFFFFCVLLQQPLSVWHAYLVACPILLQPDT